MLTLPLLILATENIGYGNNEPGEAIKFFVTSNCAYVLKGESGLQIIDVSNPASPTFTGSYDTPSSAEDVSVSGSYAYVADGESGL